MKQGGRATLPSSQQQQRRQQQQRQQQQTRTDPGDGARAVLRLLRFVRADRRVVDRAARAAAHLLQTYQNSLLRGGQLHHHHVLLHSAGESVLASCLMASAVLAFFISALCHSRGTREVQEYAASVPKFPTCRDSKIFVLCGNRCEHMSQMSKLDMEKKDLNFSKIAPKLRILSVP